MGFKEILEIEFRAQTKNLDRAMDSVTRRTDQFGSSIATLGRRINTQFVASIQVAVVQLKTFATELTKVGAEFEQSITTLGAIKGADPTALSSFSAEARRLGASTAYTATQAAEGMQELARAGLQTNEILKITGSALEFAGANAITMQLSTKLLASTMKQFNLASYETNQILDTFTTATQNSLFDVDSLAVAMRYGGSVASSLGADLSETVAVMASFRDLGLEGSMVGTRFRQILLSLAAPTEKLERLLKAYGLTAADINVETRGLTEVFRTLGDAGLTSATLLTPFVSKRAAGSLAALASQLQGTISFTRLQERAAIAFNASLDDLDDTQLEQIIKDIRIADKAFELFGKNVGKLNAQEFTKAVSSLEPELLTIENSISKIDKMQILFAKNAGVTGRTYKDMINTISGQYKILLSAIEEFQIATFKAFNMQYIDVNGNKVFTGLIEVLEMLKNEFDIMAIVVKANTSIMSSEFTRFVEIGQKAFRDFFEIKTSEEFYASIVNGLSNVNTTLEEFTGYIPTFNTLFTVGKLSFFTVLAFGIRTALIHLTQFGALISGSIAQVGKLGLMIDNAAKSTQATTTPAANLTFKLQGVVQVLLTIANLLQEMILLMQQLNYGATTLSGGYYQASNQLMRMNTQFAAMTAGQVQMQGTTAVMGAKYVKAAKDATMATAGLGTVVAATGKSVTLLGTAITRIFAVAFRALTGWVGFAITALLMFYPQIMEFLGLSDKAVDKTDEITASAKKLKAAIDTLDFETLEKFANVGSSVDPITLPDQRQNIQNLKTQLITSGEMNQSLLRELNLVRDLTEEQRNKMVLAGELLSYNVQINGINEKILLSTNAIAQMSKLDSEQKQNTTNNLLAQRQAHVDLAETIKDTLSDNEVAQLKLLQGQLASLERFKSSSVQFAQQLAIIKQDMIAMGGDFEQAALRAGNNYSDMAGLVDEVNIALEKRNRSEEYFQRLQTDFQDKVEKERVAKQRASSRGRSRERQLQKFEEKVNRERLKVAVQRVNQTKALEQQFKIEDLRKKYDKEVKYFGKSRAEMLKIERSFARMVLIIADTTFDKYSQEIAKSRKTLALERAKLLGTDITAIDADLGKELQEVNDYFEEFINLQRQSYDEGQKANVRRVELGIQGVDKKDQQQLLSELEKFQSELLQFGEDRAQDIKIVDARFDSEELKVDPALREEYLHEIGLINTRYQQSLKEFSGSVASNTMFGFETLSAALPKNMQLLTEFIQDSEKQVTRYSDSLKTAAVSQYEKELFLNLKRDKEIQEVRDKHYQELLDLQDSYASKYDLPFQTFERDKESALKRLHLEGATLEELAKFNQAYNEKFLFEQQRVIEETARQYGKLTELRVGLEVGQIVGETASLLGVSGIKELFDTSVKVFDDLYNLQEKFEEDQAKLKSSIADDTIIAGLKEEISSYDKEIQQVESTIADLINANKIAAGFATDEIKSLVSTMNSQLDSHLQIEVEAIVDESSFAQVEKQIEKIEVEALQAQYKNDPKEQERLLQLSEDMRNALNVEKQKFVQSKQNNKNLINQFKNEKNILETKKGALAADLKTKIVAGKNAKKALKLLKIVKVVKTVLVAIKSVISVILGVINAIVGILKASKKFLSFFATQLKKIVSFTKSVIDYFTGLNTNIFDSFAESVDNFIDKENEALEKLKELDDQLASRKITEDEYAKAIEGGIGEIDSTQIAKNFVNDIYKNAVQRINAFVKMAPRFFKLFTKILDPLFRRLRRALPKIAKGLSDTVPKFLVTLAKNFVKTMPVIFEGIRRLIRAVAKEFSSNAPGVINDFFDTLAVESQKTFALLQEIAPEIDKLLGKVLPKILHFISRVLDYLGKNMDSLVPYILNIMIKLQQIGLKLFLELTENAIEAYFRSIGTLTGRIIQYIGKLIRGEYGTEEEQAQRRQTNQQIGDTLLEIFTLGLKKTETYGDTPGVIRAGSDGLMARFKAGDYIMAAQEPEVMLHEVLRTFTSGMKNMVSSVNTTVPPVPPAMGGATNVDIAIIAEGRLLDAVQVSAMDRGHAPQMQRRFRRASGVNVGFNRGKFNRF